MSLLICPVSPLSVFSRGHATLHLAVSVGPSVRPSQIFLKLRLIFELPLLPNRPRLDCRVSGLVILFADFFLCIQCRF